jgi:hypothetical protein
MTDLSFQYPERAYQGPLDSSELRDLRPFHDFGSIRVPNRPDLAIRLEVDETTGNVVAVAIDVAQSSVQLQVFASPRGESLWPEIRDSLAASVAQQGGKVTPQLGAFGDELFAEFSRSAIGDSSYAPRHLKFIGVDGPRWFLRVTVTGAALTDPAAAGVVEDVIRGVVINRGEAAMPPRELLPLVMPPGAAASGRL